PAPERVLRERFLPLQHPECAGLGDRLPEPLFEADRAVAPARAFGQIELALVADGAAMAAALVGSRHPALIRASSIAGEACAFRSVMRLPKDPRWLQIAFLCSFLLLGLTARDFPIWHAPLLFAACLGTQLACERLLNLPHAGLLSPIITSFGLTLLLRAGSWWVPPLAGVLAIGSKYALR